MSFTVLNEEIDANLFTVEKFLYDCILRAADFLCLIKSNSQFIFIDDLFNTFRAISIDRFDYEWIVKMPGLFNIKLIHNHILRCGNLILDKDFLHQFFVRDQFRCFIIYVPRKAQFFRNLGYYKKHLIRTNGDKEINLLFNGNLFYRFNVKYIDVIKLVGIRKRNRCRTTIHKDGFRSTLFQLFY